MALDTFTPDWSTLSSPKIWLKLYTKCMDTGAAWGLILTMALICKADDIM